MGDQTRDHGPFGHAVPTTERGGAQTIDLVLPEASPLALHLMGEGAESMFRGLVEAAPDAMVIVDPEGRIVLVNRQTEQLFGWSREQLVGAAVEVLIPASTRDRHRQHREDFGENPQLRPMGVGVELHGLRADGTEFPLEISLSPLETDHGVLVSAAIRDITERRRAERAMTHQATHDALTGLPNRVLLEDRLQQAILRSEREETTVALLFIDVDRLKHVNDTRGHAAGDELLRAVAERLRTCVRPADTLARLGGDEFVIITEGLPVGQGPQALAERVAGALTGPVRLGDAEVLVTASIGVAMSGPGGDPTSLLRDADAAMYQAKEQGRDRYVVFDEALRADAAQQRAVASELREALVSDQLVVHYQPVVELTGGKVIGVEALVRWRHPLRGLLPPGEFVAIAEDTGLVAELGGRVLREACSEVARWGREHPELSDLCVSVNLSPRQLVSTEVVDTVRDALEAARLNAEHLCIEITESALLDDPLFSAGALAALKDLGVQIAVDDFGTGYSSLTYLQRFPVDTLKIDRSFVDGVDLHDNPRGDRAIVVGVIDLAHAFGLTAVAEGVETTSQLDALRTLGCERAQGYYWSPALPADEALAWILEHKDGPTELEPEPTASIRVLLVDDEAPVRRLLSTFLETEPGFSVVGETGDGREAIALARHHQPDVVLLDLAMPGIGGLEALPLLRAVCPTSKVIVLSGLDAAGIEARARAKGGSAYVFKGGSLDQLPELMRYLVPEEQLADSAAASV